MFRLFARTEHIQLFFLFWPAVAVEESFVLEVIAVGVGPAGAVLAAFVEDAILGAFVEGAAFEEAAVAAFAEGAAFVEGAFEEGAFADFEEEAFADFKEAAFADFEEAAFADFEEDVDVVDLKMLLPWTWRLMLKIAPLPWEVLCPDCCPALPKPLLHCLLSKIWLRMTYLMLLMIAQQTHLWLVQRESLQTLQRYY
ncbi:hypothetical protein ACA910_016784 [Epithemia clementina (nom. ined.)]